MPPTITFWEAFRFWLKLGFINFGGPSGQIAIMHQELVDRRRWISNDRFLHALSFCMLLPGPEAQQLAIYVGWLFHRTPGGVVAGVLFVLPAFFVMLTLSWLYAVHGHLAWVTALFYGLRAAVIAIVAAAVLRIGSRALRNRVMVWVAATAFLAIFVAGVPFPLIVIAAGLVGVVGGRWWPQTFSIAPTPGSFEGSATVLRDDHPPAEHTRPTVARIARALLFGIAIWWLPLLAVMVWRGRDDVVSQEAIFFSKAAMVTFGGAYAVLTYIAQAAVQQFHWLAPGEMLDGLGMAESTPGPLILVTQFVGFIAAFRHPGGMDPVAAGSLGAAVTVWATFAPCFLWIFLGAPFIERLRGHQILRGALTTITAAVVGVILNLAVWFGIHTLFGTVRDVPFLLARLPAPAPASLDPIALLIAAVAFVGMWRYRWGIVTVVAGSAAAGLLVRFLLS